MTRLNKFKKAFFEENTTDGLIILNPADLRYLSGVATSDASLLITKNEDFILSDARYKFVIERQEEFTPIVITKPLILALAERANELKLSSVVMDKKYLLLSDYMRFKEAFKGEIILKADLTADLRIIKDRDEIENIKAAQEIAEKAFLALLNNGLEGMTTKQAAAFLDYNMAVSGSEEPAFATIAACGAKSADCHAIPDGTLIRKGDFVLFDFGATVNGLRSDMTRTVSVGEPDSFKAEIYNIVLEAHLKAVSVIKDGLPAREADAAARNYIKEKGFGEDFLHSLGHGVGFDIHEAPTLSEKSEAILKKNMAVTVEPGIYLKDKFGVRIEDTVIVTETGCESVAKLTKELLICK